MLFVRFSIQTEVSANLGGEYYAEVQEKADAESRARD